MLVRSDCALTESPRPRSFAGLMELYESNYMRFRKLCPMQYGVGGRAVSTVTDGLDLHLRVLECSSYTTTVHLTYYLRDGGGVRPNPDLRLRIYYDALQAEVLGCSSSCLRDKSYARVINWRAELADKWSMNCFLHKWLGYCLSQRHVFPSNAMYPQQRYHRLLKSAAG